MRSSRPCAIVGERWPLTGRCRRPGSRTFIRGKAVRLYAEVRRFSRRSSVSQPRPSRPSDGPGHTQSGVRCGRSVRPTTRLPPTSPSPPPFPFSARSVIDGLRCRRGLRAIGSRRNRPVTPHIISMDNLPDGFFTRNRLVTNAAGEIGRPPSIGSGGPGTRYHRPSSAGSGFGTPAPTPSPNPMPLGSTGSLFIARMVRLACYPGVRRAVRDRSPPSGQSARPGNFRRTFSIFGSAWKVQYASPGFFS